MILDAGILFAAADKSQRHHADARKILAKPGSRVVVEPALAEADYLILKHVGVAAEIQFVRALSEGTLAIETPTVADRRRAADLVERHRDLKIGYVDAVTVAIAERLGETMIATLDQRHFRAIQPSHIPAFVLFP